jgi:hypothetical protein
MQTFYSKLQTQTPLAGDYGSTLGRLCQINLATLLPLRSELVWSGW